jgi:hypothetical protein
MASPWRAADAAGRAANRERALAACREAVCAGHAPFAPHLLFPRFLDDGDPAERAAGMRAALAFLAACEAVWVYGPVTEGVAAEIAEARRLGIPVVFKDGRAKGASDGIEEREDGARRHDRTAGASGDGSRRRVGTPPGDGGDGAERRRPDPGSQRHADEPAREGRGREGRVEAR